MLICEMRYPSLSTAGETAKINKPQNILQHLNSTVTDQRRLLMSGRTVSLERSHAESRGKMQEKACRQELRETEVV